MFLTAVNIPEVLAMITLEFLITSLVVVLIPGTGVIYTVSTGLLAGRRAAVAAAIGCTAGIIPHLLACISGLSLIMHTSALAFQVVKYAGAAYLLYMAWQMWHDMTMVEFGSGTNSTSGPQRIIRGFLLNILNPKLTIFFLAFLPQFVAGESSIPAPAQLLILSGVFMLMTFIVFVIYGLFAHQVRSYIINSPTILRRMQKSFALIFAALGVKLALTK
ncbi:MAG: LysE family translocator [Sedimentisphaerales bacterium]|nr:LysE family translocator [Sedimentisphaerales bacterium]